MLHKNLNRHILFAIPILAMMHQGSWAATIKVACVQMQVSNSIETNTSRIVELLGAEAAQGTRVAVFPECAISGYDGKLVPNIPQASIDAAVERVTAACRQNRIYAIVGTTWFAEGVRTNVALVIGPDGKVLCRYAKMHVVEPYNKNGDQLAWFTIDGVPATLFVCHDERYPELMRIPVLAGAKIGFYISFESEASSGKNFNYRCQIVGRAVENQTWVVSCNAPAKNECGESHGQSRIISPDGTIRQEAGDAETVIREVIDTDLSSNERVQAASRRAPLDQFWQEGLRALQSQHVDAFGSVRSKPQLLADRGRPRGSPNAKLRIACVQAASSGSIESTVVQMVESIARHASERARVVVFPECALTGANASTLGTLDQADIDSALNKIGQACRENNVYCIVGSAFRDQGKIHNGAFVFGPAGELIDRYAQIYPEKPDAFAPGDRMVMFRIDGVYATILIGHDIYYPELTRIATLGGAKVNIVLGSDRATRRPDTSEAMAVCRSVENQVFTVWCSAGSGNGAGESSGHSRIVSPSGKILAGDSELHDTAILAAIDTAQASYNYPRAGAGTPSLAAFWQEGLDVLWGQNPWLSEKAVKNSAPATRAASAQSDWHQQLATPWPEFSPMPFWFWNDELTDEEIVRQMADFREHGVYGFVIHGRMGLPKSIPYMGERWMHFVQTAVEEAARTGMRVCLYDEGMYPSGSAHGEVVKSNPAFAARGLAMESRDVTGPTKEPLSVPAGADHVATVLGKVTDNKGSLDGDSLRLIDPASKQVDVPAGNWRLMTFTCVPSEGRIRGVHADEEETEPGAPQAADLLNPEAMKAFIRFAYEPYYAAVGKHFGKAVLGMFTDEPSMLGRRPKRGLKPWTTGFAGYFESKRGYSPAQALPGLFVDIGPKTAAIRNDVELTLAERLDETYYLQLSRWCEEHGIALTGHPAGATEIQPLRFFQIPGQDIVWRGVAPKGHKALQGTNSAIAKCSSSVARYDGRSRNSNEVFGAFGWQLTMEEMKWLSDWLMVRGVDLLYPHAFYYSTREQRGNERPPDVGPHNLWWPHYKLLADYTARICGMLSGSRQICEVAILGSNRELPWRAAEFLYRNQVDFNYLEDWRLIQQATYENGKLVVGPMKYSLVIVDQGVPPTGAVAEALVRFESAGGTVRYCRETPNNTLIDGLARDVQASPAAADLRYAHMIKQGIHYYFLVNEGEKEIVTQLTIRGRGCAEWFDPWRGTFRPAEANAAGDDSFSVPLVLDRRESIVLCVDSSQPLAPGSRQTAYMKPSKPVAITGPWTVLGSEGRQVGNTLGDWLKVDATSSFAGTLTYRTGFTYAKAADTEYVIDLGAVGDFATVTLNGHALPVRLWTPYQWTVTQWLADGANELRVDVTNSLVNRYDAKIRRASGLLGPVEIVPMTRDKSQAASSRRPGKRIRIASLQMLPATGDVKANVAHAEELVRQAVVQHGAQLLVLPECTVQGYTNPADGKMTLEQTREIAEPIPGPSVDRFAKLAGELGVYIVLGVHEKRNDRYLNSAAILSPDGHLVGTYSKVHINKYEQQMGWTNGDTFHVWPCEIGGSRFNLGVMICFDREVPEAARSLAVLGADLIVIPQATSCTARFPIHRDQLRVRAFENEVYLAMANWAGPSFMGNSMIIDPRGEVMKLGGEGEEILLADVDLDSLARIREAGIYGQHHRQPMTYGALVAPQR